MYKVIHKIIFYGWNILMAYSFIEGTVAVAPNLESDDTGGTMFGLLLAWIIIFTIWTLGNSILKSIGPSPQTVAKEKTNSSADELKKWSDLRDSGVITDEEFQKKKNKIISGTDSRWWRS